MKTRTIICDIDGCVFKHHGNGAAEQWCSADLLPGVVDRFNEWEAESACIVLMTARKESCRSRLEQALLRHGLFWDHLIMGVGHGERVIINDVTPQKPCSVRAINVTRNMGLTKDV